MRNTVSVEIDLKAIKHNFTCVNKYSESAAVIPVIKADAYGHGAEEVAKALENMRIYAFGVAYLCEAIILRESGIKNKIIVFFDTTNPSDIIKYDIIPVIYNLTTAQQLSRAALKLNKQIDVHINIDTGMGRLGFLFDRDITIINDKVSKLAGINITGVMSHFSEADLLDREFAKIQLERFVNAKKELPNINKNAIWHISNSAAVMTFKDARLDAVRPGLMLYGYSPFGDADTDLKPAMKVMTRLLDVRLIPAGKPISYGRTFVTKRQSLIGVLPIGYADGYSRLYSNQAHVIIRGQSAPIVGRVCMDVTMADVTDIIDVQVNDDVILLGDGTSAYELSKIAQTIPYEVIIALGNTNSRRYENNGFKGRVSDPF
ncbi:MAG: alanine racemase [Nitrospirae bacterium]|nr:alanine racemase [Nitrospirota bacterium]